MTDELDSLKRNLPKGVSGVISKNKLIVHKGDATITVWKTTTNGFHMEHKGRVTNPRTQQDVLLAIKQAA